MQTAMMQMQVQDHVQTAFDFLEASDREFAAGDNMQASEKLWGAASHAVIAVAEDRNWNHGSHRALKNVVARLSIEQDDPLIETRFVVAEKFHINFYYNTMEDFEIERDRPHVHEFVRRVTALVSPNADG